MCLSLCILQSQIFYVYSHRSMHGHQCFDLIIQFLVYSFSIRFLNSSIANLCIIYKLLLPFHHIPDIRESYGIARSQTGFFVNAQAASVQKGAISGI